MLLQATGTSAALVVLAVVIVIAGEGFGTTAVTVGLASLPVWTLRRSMHVLGSRARLLVATAMILFAPFVAFAAWRKLTEPIVGSSESTSEPALVIIGALTFVPLATASLALAWTYVGRRSQFADRLWLRAAKVAIGLSALTSAFAALSRHRRIEVERWRESLPIVDVVGGLAWQRTSGDDEVIRRYEARVHGGLFTAACPFSRDCEMSFTRTDSVTVTTKLHGYAWDDRVRTDYRIRRDIRHDLLILEVDLGGYETRCSGDSWHAAFGPRGWVHPLGIGELRDVIAPPGEWFIVALAGLVLASAVYARGAVRRRNEEKAPWIEGRVEADGSVTLADGTRLPSSDHIEPGTSVVARDIEPGSPTYRSVTPARAASMMAGTRGDRSAAARDDEIGYAACAVALVAVTIAPLIVCAALGLLQ
jgi:hypothetical protein